MSRDTFVSWKTLALFVLFPPLALVAIVFFPVTIGVVRWLYYRGKNKARLAELEATDSERVDGYYCDRRPRRPTGREWSPCHDSGKGRLSAVSIPLAGGERFHFTRGSTATEREGRF